jgi:hypothetical protein
MAAFNVSGPGGTSTSAARPGPAVKLPNRINAIQDLEAITRASGKYPQLNQTLVGSWAYTGRLGDLSTH